MKAKKIGPKKGIILQIDDVRKSQNSLKMLGFPDVPRQITQTIELNFLLYFFCSLYDHMPSSLSTSSYCQDPYCE